MLLCRIKTIEWLKPKVYFAFNTGLPAMLTHLSWPAWIIHEKLMHYSWLFSFQIVAVIIEGRNASERRRRNNDGYQKLDQNLSDVMPSLQKSKEYKF